MKIDIHCKGMSLTDAIHDHVDEKLGKLEKILPGEIDVLTIVNYDAGSRGGLYTVEVSLRAWGTDIIAKEVDEDLYRAVAAVSDATFAQARKLKEKRRRKGKSTVRNYVPAPDALSPEEEDELDYDIDYEFEPEPEPEPKKPSQ